MQMKRRKTTRKVKVEASVTVPEVKGVVISDGKLARGGRLQVGRRIVDLPDAVREASGLEGVTSGAVKVAVSAADKKSIVAIGTIEERLNRIRWILCYIPAPEILRRLEPRIREALLDGMVAEKVISAEFAELARGAARGDVG